MPLRSRSTLVFEDTAESLSSYSHPCQSHRHEETSCAHTLWIWSVSMRRMEHDQRDIGHAEITAVARPNGTAAVEEHYNAKDIKWASHERLWLSIPIHKAISPHWDRKPVRVYNRRPQTSFLRCFRNLCHPYVDELPEISFRRD